MTQFELKEKIKRVLGENLDYLKVGHRILVEFKESGGSQDEALRELEELRKWVGPADEDKILELMDFVSGFCNPKFRIWQTKI
ncbi:MAG: hypothetical protein AAFR66_11300 [Bacteroidota bacterium]